MTRITALLFMLTVALCGGAFASQDPMRRTQAIVETIVSKSYPEINSKKIRIKSFNSDSNFFKARFSLVRFFTFQKMRHLVFVNPKAFEYKISDDAIRGIIAHELAHILYYTKKNRVQLLGLTGLASGKFNTKFERKADLDAIVRGYGNELIEYRRWLYKNISQETQRKKKRDYFTPDEIRILIPFLKKNPQLVGKLKKDVPLDLSETRAALR